MAKDSRVLNITRGFRLKHNQGLRAIEQCACAWVEFGVSIRDLTLAESIAKRNEQAANREPLANCEIPGLIFKQPTNAQSTAYARGSLITQANRYCADYAGG